MIGLYIYLLGVLAVAIYGGYSLYSEYIEKKRLKMSVGRCVWVFVFLVFSWVSMVYFGAAWLQDHADDIIINIGKDEEDGKSNC